MLQRLHCWVYSWTFYAAADRREVNGLSSLTLGPKVSETMAPRT